MQASKASCPACGKNSHFKFKIDVRPIYKCSACELVFVHPQPTDEQLAASYKDLYFGSEAIDLFTDDHILSQIVARYIQPQIDDFKKAHPDKKPAIIDFGAGSGRMVALMRSMGLDAFGVEPNAPSINSKYIYHSFRDLLRDVTQDFVIASIIMNEVIEHIRDPRDSLKELYLNLSDGGFLLIGTPNVKSLRARIFGRFYSEFRNPTHLYFFEENSLNAMIFDATGAQGIRLKSDIDFGPSSFARRILRKVLQKLSLDGSLRMIVRKN